MTKQIVLNFTIVFWVAKTMEESFHYVGSKEFIRTFRLGDTLLTLLKGLPKRLEAF